MRVREHRRAELLMPEATRQELLEREQHHRAAPRWQICSTKSRSGFSVGRTGQVHIDNSAWVRAEGRVSDEEAECPGWRPMCAIGGDRVCDERARGGAGRRQPFRPAGHRLEWLGREAAAGSVRCSSTGVVARRPPHTPAAITRRVGDIQVPSAGAVRNWPSCLRRKASEESPRTIDRIIRREGWTRPDAAPAPALHRFRCRAE